MVSVKYATTTKIFDRKLCSLIHCCDKLDLAMKNYCHVWITILSIVQTLICIKFDGFHNESEVSQYFLAHISKVVDILESIDENSC